MDDQSPHCGAWAKAGECETNQKYMQKVCAESCASRATANCALWAAEGECDKNPEYMTKVCSQSCTRASARKAEIPPEEPEDPAENHPGGPRCFYDALAHGCPSSISSDGRALLCSCDYFDNAWLGVLGKFNIAFRTGAYDRTSIASRFDARLEANGIVSMDVGLPVRLQCGAALTGVYPGSNFEANVEELYRFLGSFIYPDVRAKLTEICLPGRIALQLICQHVFIHGFKDFLAAKAYAVKMKELLTMVDTCLDDQTPWSFPGLKKFLRPWLKDELPHPSQMAWYPDPALMQAKTPDQTPNHYFPCVPLKDPECFPSGSNSEGTSCMVCCDPGAGPQGNAACFDGVFSFSRCCQTPPGTDRFY